MSQSNTYQSLTILIPAICSVIVLTVILIVACFVVSNKRRPVSAEHNMLSNIEQNCRDDHILSDAFQLSILEPRKENNCADSNVCANSATKQVYYPSPFAISRERQMCVESDMSSLNSLSHSRREHVYDIPFPPKWV